MYGRLLLIAAFGSAVLPSAAMAQPGQHATTVTISGDHGGYADLTLPRDTTFTKDPYGTSMVVSGGRTYAGACLVPFDGRYRRQGIPSAPCLGRIARVPHVGASTMLLDTDDARLPAGRYRMYLFADGPARVTITVPGELRSLTLTARGAAPQVSLTFTETSLSPEVARRQLYAPVPPVGITWAGWSMQGVSPAAVGAEDLCATPVGTQCFSRYTTGDRGYDITASGSHGAGGWAASTSFGPDHFPAYTGGMDVFFTEAYTDVTTSVLGWVLSADFGTGPTR